MALTCLIERVLVRLLEFAFVWLFSFPGAATVSGPPTIILLVVVLSGLLSTFLTSIEHRYHSLKL